MFSFTTESTHDFGKTLTNGYSASFAKMIEECPMVGLNFGALGLDLGMNQHPVSEH
jgi:hypothetical protein